MINIALLAGGNSSEREIALQSAAQVAEAFDRERYNVWLIDVYGRRFTYREGGEEYYVDLNDFSLTIGDRRVEFDFAYIMIHGTPGENGILQGYFDLIGMPYSTSGVFVEALTFNKFALNNYLRAFPQINVSDSYVVRKGLERPADAEIIQRLGLPCFVKPNAGGSSFGVTKVKTEADLAPAIEKAMKTTISLTKKRRKKENQQAKAQCRNSPSLIWFLYTLDLILQPECHPCKIH